LFEEERDRKLREYEAQQRQIMIRAGVTPPEITPRPIAGTEAGRMYTVAEAENLPKGMRYRGTDGRMYER
jgi:hypothetical protein